MRIYLAARYPRREELCGYRGDLEARGHLVTSRWLAGNEQVTANGTALGAQGETWFESGHPRAAQTRALFARRDLEDINAAELFIAFTEDLAAGIPPGAARGGRNVELGYALARPMPVVVCGPRENLFCHLPEVLHYPDWAGFLEACGTGLLATGLLAALLTTNIARLEPAARVTPAGRSGS
jgi:hypothetical protein